MMSFNSLFSFYLDNMSDGGSGLFKFLSIIRLVQVCVFYAFYKFGCVSVYLCVCMYVCVHVCVYKHVCICMYVCILGL